MSNPFSDIIADTKIVEIEPTPAEMQEVEADDLWSSIRYV